MIKIERTDEPETLQKNAKDWLDIYLVARTAYRTTPNEETKKAKTNAESRYNNPKVKTALKAMCHDKCAYCESHVTHVDYGHIEHFKPKATYPELCFAWRNLLLGCAICNGPEYKSDYFPLAAEGGPLINPAEEDPAIFFRFEYDPATGTANVIPQHPRGFVTEELLGLNRAELVQHRSKVVRRLALVALQANSGNVEALAELKKSMEPDEEYAAFARAFFQKFNLGREGLSH